MPSTVDKHLLNRHHETDWLMRNAYPQFDADGTSKLNSIDLAYLKDLDISSTTESQAPSTLPPNNKEVESCTSFEYHKNGIINSPFQREIQRLLDSSTSKIPVPVTRIGGGGAGAGAGAGSTSSGVGATLTTNTNNYFNHRPPTKIANNYSNYRNGTSPSSSNTRQKTNMTKYEFESVDKPNNYMQVMLNSSGNGHTASSTKHPVGLEAIKEIAKNNTASETNHM